MKLAGLTLTAASIAFSVTAASASVCEEPVRIGWDNWAPYQIKQDNMPTGIDIDIATAIADEVGCEIAWVESPWKRQLKAVETGDIDAVMTASYTDERDAYGTFSEKYLDYQSILWVNSDNNNTYSSLKDFLDQGKNLGIARGYTYGEETDAMLKEDAYKSQIKTANKPELNLRMLSVGRIDGTLGNRFTIGYRAKENDIRGDIRATDAVVQTDPVHHLFSEASVSEDLIAAWDKAIVKLRDNGVFEDIVQEYTGAN